MNMYKKTKIFIAGLALLALSQSVLAAPLQYTIEGTSGAMSYLELESGVHDISGLSFTITGSTSSDTNVGIYAGNSTVGQFNTIATFDFGAGLSFTSDSSTDLFWVQNCGSAISMVCAGLGDTTVSEGFVALFAAPLAVSDITVGQAFAGQTPGGFGGPGFSNLTNSNLNQALGFTIASLTFIEATSSVPEPAIILLFSFGLAGLGLSRRRKM